MMNVRTSMRVLGGVAVGVRLVHDGRWRHTVVLVIGDRVVTRGRDGTPRPAPRPIPTLVSSALPTSGSCARRPRTSSSRPLSTWRRRLTARRR